MIWDMTDDGARAAYAASILGQNLTQHWAARLPQLLDEAVADCVDGCGDLQLIYPDERVELARAALLRVVSGGRR